MAILRKLRSFLALTPANRELTREAALLPMCVSAGFRLFGVSRTQRVLRNWALRKSAVNSSDPAADIRAARRAQRIVRRSLRIGGTCLTSSLTLWAVLLRRGVRSDLRVGFRRRDGRIEGHAWVEYQGLPINEAADEVRTYDARSGPVSFDLKPVRFRG